MAQRYGVLPSDILGLNKSSNLSYSINLAVCYNSINNNSNNNSKLSNNSNNGCKIQQISEKDLINYQKEISKFF
ncbi:hypothetical protein J3E07_001571 [Methanococcus voltae]|uniref:Uncharacterized protein n=1 Tax=Methanococcus voltae TaxID=2188 RepID=A0A8J7S2H8_METVO|nr:hypothetical protein [Methanococcus voltae]MBP2202130.1 hypothetical protein [Methanococcus voltae]